MADNVETNSRSRTFAWIGTLVILLPLLYVLSIGPAAVIASKTRYAGNIRQFYLPVIWLHEHTVLKRPLEIYVGFWGVR